MKLTLAKNITNQECGPIWHPSSIEHDGTVLVPGTNGLIYLARPDKTASVVLDAEDHTILLAWFFGALFPVNVPYSPRSNKLGMYIDVDFHTGELELCSVNGTHMEFFCPWYVGESMSDDIEFEPSPELDQLLQSFAKKE